MHIKNADNGNLPVKQCACSYWSVNSVRAGHETAEHGQFECEVPFRDEI